MDFEFPIWFSAGCHDLIFIEDMSHHVLTDPSFSFEGNAEFGSHFVSIEINEAVVQFFCVSHAFAWSLLGNSIGKFGRVILNSNVTIITRIKSLVM